MLAQLGKGDPPASDDWLYEIKWDGVRALCYSTMAICACSRATATAWIVNILSCPSCRITSRPDRRFWTARSPRSIPAASPALSSFRSASRFPKPRAIATLARNHPVVLFLFDLLYLDGYDLRGVPLVERKRLLKEMLEPSDVIRYSEHFAGNGADLLAAVKQQGLEGIIGKRASSMYESRRTSDWVKYKVTNSDSFILCGFTKGDRELFGALVLGIYDRGELTWAGNVGTGFDRKLMQAIYDRLAPLAIDKCPLKPAKELPKDSAVTWTRPELVCEVKFANWTDDGRLRAPVFLGLRPDIDPADCVRNPAPDPEHTPLLDSSLAEASLVIDGHRLKFTNLNKIFYPKDGIVKRDLLNYYDAVAPMILPHLKDRPLSLKRYPNGIDEPFFFQKEVAESFPKWLRTGDRRRHPPRHRRRPRDPPVPGQPRLHRPQSLDEPIGFDRASGLPPDRPRSARLPLLEDRRGSAVGPRQARPS